MGRYVEHSFWTNFSREVKEHKDIRKMISAADGYGTNERIGYSLQVIGGYIASFHQW